MRAASLRPAMVAMRAGAAPRIRPVARAARPALGSRLQPGASVPSSLLLRRAAAAYATDSKAGQTSQPPPQAPPPPSQGDSKKFGLKNSTLFTVLIGVGLLMTIYGV